MGLIHCSEMIEGENTTMSSEMLIIDEVTFDFL